MPLVGSFMEDERVHRQNLADAINKLADARLVSLFTRDLTLAAGLQSITGVGFRPKVILFFANIDSAPQMSICANDARTNAGEGIQDYSGIVADSYQLVQNVSVILTVNSTTRSFASLSSIDADGFTLSWQKDGSPTGTAAVGYLAWA